MLLFNSMLNHGYTPESFLMSTMIPIVKHKHADISCINNYRAIAINNLLKLIDRII